MSITFSHHADPQATFKAPLMANGNAFIGNIFSRWACHPRLPVKCSIRAVPLNLVTMTIWKNHLFRPLQSGKRRAAGAQIRVWRNEDYQRRIVPNPIRQSRGWTPNQEKCYTFPVALRLHTRPSPMVCVSIYSSSFPFGQMNVDFIGHSMFSQGIVGTLLIWLWTPYHEAFLTLGEAQNRLKGELESVLKLTNQQEETLLNSMWPIK